MRSEQLDLATKSGSVTVPGPTATALPTYRAVGNKIGSRVYVYTVCMVPVHGNAGFLGCAAQTQSASCCIRLAQTAATAVSRRWAQGTKDAKRRRTACSAAATRELSLRISKLYTYGGPSDASGRCWGRPKGAYACLGAWPGGSRSACLAGRPRSALAKYLRCTLNAEEGNRHGLPGPPQLLCLRRVWSCSASISSE